MIASPACLTLGLALMCLAAAPAFAEGKENRPAFEAEIATGYAPPPGEAGERISIDDDVRKADLCGPDCTAKPARLVVTLSDDFGVYKFGEGGVGAGVSGDLSSTRLYLVPGSGGSAFVRARRPAFRGVCGCR